MLVYCGMHQCKAMYALQPAFNQPAIASTACSVQHCRGTATRLKPTLLPLLLLICAWPPAGPRQDGNGPQEHAGSSGGGSWLLLTATAAA